MLVSLCVIAYNEEAALKGLFDNIAAQNYPKPQTQIVFVNDCSTDGTKRLMQGFADKYKSYHSVVVADCRVKSQAAAWNTAILNSAGEIIIRLDAHSTIPANFISENVRCIESGEYVCGGGRPTKAMEETPWQMTLLAAEDSLFGSSFACYRRESEKRRYVDSVFHAAYRREVFRTVGGFNECLGRTEDNELHYRIRKAGYKICCEPKIKSYQYIRSGLIKMMKQKYGNGLWVALTLGVSPGCISLFHLAPLVLVLMLIVFSVMAGLGCAAPLVLLCCAYLFFDLTITAGVFINRKKYLQFVALPVIFSLLHLSYGIGSLVGIIKMPFWRINARKKSPLGIQRVKDKLMKEEGENNGLITPDKA